MVRIAEFTPLRRSKITVRDHRRGVEFGIPLAWATKNAVWRAKNLGHRVGATKQPLPSREEDTNVAFAVKACCNAILDAIACCLSKL